MILNTRLSISCAFLIGVFADNDQTSNSFSDMQSTSSFNFDVSTHGCNCPAVYDDFAIGGSQINNDPFDKICQNLRRCNNCAAKSTSCTGDYKTVEFTWNKGNSTGDATCGTNTDACGKMKCDCYMQFVNEMELFNHTAVGNSDWTEHANIPASTNDCKVESGLYRGCCLNSANEWKMYNEETHACTNGELSEIALHTYSSTNWVNGVCTNSEWKQAGILRLCTGYLNDIGNHGFARCPDDMIWDAPFSGTMDAYRVGCVRLCSEHARDNGYTFYGARYYARGCNCHTLPVDRVHKVGGANYCYLAATA